MTVNDNMYIKFVYLGTKNQELAINMRQNEAFDGTDEVTEAALDVASTTYGSIISSTTSKVELNVDDYIKSIGEFGRPKN